MCGIVGILNVAGDALEAGEVVRRMAGTLTHRGPDDEGYYADGPVNFGFRRLSIIDLETGKQPFCSPDHKVAVMFNGEIYNFLELKKTLEQKGHTFKTRSEAEVILHAWQSYGVDFLTHLRGMFALALWDGENKRLVLARDRAGQKPLYYAEAGGQLAFASEIKALLHWPSLERRINPRALGDYLGCLFVPAPSSIFDQVRKLAPACVLVADCGRGTWTLKRYWDVCAQPDRSRSFEDYSEELQASVEEAVKIRLRSEVPLGAFLSGGVDSSIIVGAMSRKMTGVKSFSIGFADKRFDESSFARLASVCFETEHFEEQVDADVYQPEDLVRLVWHMDEPFGDSSFIPTHWLCKTARKQVTVALSGDGGDELFAGYTRYRNYQRLEGLHACPRGLRRAGEAVAGMIKRVVRPWLPGAAERLRQLQKALSLSLRGENERMMSMLSYFDEAQKAQMYQEDWQQLLEAYRSEDPDQVPIDQSEDSQDPLARFMAYEIRTSMADDILAKVDRASMACSLEVRCPFLDHHVIECAMSIPPEYKIRNGMQKIILKHAFRDLLPETIRNRKKQGFEVPFASWFQKEPWHSFLLDMLSESRLKEQGIFNPQSVIGLRDALIRDPEARRLDLSGYQLRHRVWALLMFQIWYQQYILDSPRSAGDQ